MRDGLVMGCVVEKKGLRMASKKTVLKSSAVFAEQKKIPNKKKKMFVHSEMHTQTETIKKDERRELIIDGVKSIGERGAKNKGRAHRGRFGVKMDW